MTSAIPSERASRLQRRDLGQVWTPDDVAGRMVELMLDALDPGVPLRVLDPCVGPGTFLRPLFEQLEACGREAEVHALDIDGQLLHETEQRFADSGTVFDVADYLDTPAECPFDAIIMNPPYVRQELIPSAGKMRYRSRLREAGLVAPGARSNLFAYFLLKAVSELRAGGVMCAIVYANMRTTKYGSELWEQLCIHLEMQVTDYLQMPFEGAMVDAILFVGQKRSSPVEQEPVADVLPPGYVRMDDLVRVQRGTDLVDRKRFVTQRPADIDCDASIPLVLRTPPVGTLSVYPEAALRKVEGDTTFPMRRLKTARVLFNYYLRNHARHLWNTEGATVSDNFLVLQPIGVTDETLWLLLNSSAVEVALREVATPQGAGLRKLQVYQYRAVSVPDWRRLGAEALDRAHYEACELIESGANIAQVREVADRLMKPMMVGIEEGRSNAHY